jgi:hypothetical protein
MDRFQICLRSLATGHLISEQWQPTVTREELRSANEALAQRSLPLRWFPVQRPIQRD